MPETMKVKPWGEDQGDFVLIDAADFDPDKHQKYEETDEVKDEFSELTNNKLKDYLTASGVSFQTNATKADLLALCRELSAKAE